MKIGAGGLETHATHDDIALRQTQETRRLDQAAKYLDERAAKSFNLEGINKTIERLNDAAESFDLPLRFVHQKNQAGDDVIEMSRTDTDAARQLELPQASVILNKMLDGKGLNVDEYI